jgi:predicted O-methyltransferase YrrM
VPDPSAWDAVDRYFHQHLIGDDPALDSALRRAAAAGLPAQDVAPNQGKLLYLLARMCGARRVLELGTLGGYSTIWLARAAREVVTLELVPAHAAVAAQNLRAAGLDDRVEILIGDALEVLTTLEEPFDLVFLDADKQRNAEYLEHALRLTRPGGVIVADNVVRDGAVADPDDPDERVVGVRRFTEALGAAAGVTATAVQTVGTKGWDGFVLALVEGEPSAS